MLKEYISILRMGVLYLNDWSNLLKLPESVDIGWAVSNDQVELEGINLAFFKGSLEELQEIVVWRWLPTDENNYDWLFNNWLLMKSRLLIRV